MSRYKHSQIDTKQSTGVSEHTGSTRRKFLAQSALAAAALAIHASPYQSETIREPETTPAKRPNILLVHSDQFRWDFISAVGLNPMSYTPNLDAMYSRGTAFQNLMTNQPLCSPSRACLFTGQYATTTGVWRLTQPNIFLSPDAVTLAKQLHKVGYSTNYIGKWHLAPKNNATGQGLGFVPPEYRGGFTDLWQASNVLELTSHPYHGTLWNGDGTPIHYKDIYRVDFLTDLAEKFLRQKHNRPFFLVLSQLEPHQQNDLNGFGPPKGYSERFRNPYSPPDVRQLPGDWPYQLANYYGDVKAIDESMGRIFKILKEQNLEDNTIVILTRDHGCHFRTRNTEYKRSPHDSSIHVPFMIQGPGFNNSRKIEEMVSMVDIMPSVLDALALPIPSTVQGRSFIPLINDPEARASWRNDVFIQISESETARVLRTPEWTYVALAPASNPNQDSYSMHYQDYQLYNNRADPAQVINLAGRIDPPSLIHYIGDRSMRKVTAELRERLIERMVEAGEKRPTIDLWPYYP